MNSTIKKIMSKALAITASVFTVAQCVLPAYAQENVVEPEPQSAITSTLSVNVEGAGTVDIQENGNTHEVTETTPLSLELEAGTQIHLSVEEQENLFISSLTEDSNTVAGFEVGSTTFDYDFVTTESAKAIVVSFDVASETENTGLSNENQSAEDEDVGETAEEELNDGNSLESEKEEKESEEDKSLTTFNAAKAAARAGQDLSGALGTGIDGQQIVDLARAWVGKFGYAHGGSPAVGMDCSGFVTLVFKQYLGTVNWQPWGNVNGSYQAGSHIGLTMSTDKYGIGTPGMMDVARWEGYLKTHGVSDSGAYNLARANSTNFDDYFNVGDIVIYYFDDNGTVLSQVGGTPHMAIYAGNNTVIHSTLISGFGAIDRNGPSVSNIVDAMNKGSVQLRSFRIFPVGEGTGEIKISKSSANPTITDGNDCYGTMEGAQYGLYSDASATQQIGTFTIGANGESNTIDELKAGTYYIKEIKAPEGYALDTQIYPVTVEAGETTTKAFTDIPQNDPVRVALGKVDKTTNSNKPQGSASLKDAQFTIKYYDGYYDSEGDFESLEPTRTWVVKTDDDGYAFLDPGYIVSGDELYTSSNGDPTLPLGTITIQETKAPEGYLLDDTLFIRKITSDGTVEGVDTYNEPIVKEQVQLGDFTIYKIKSSSNESSISQPEEGAEFTAIYKGYVDQYGSFEEAMKHTSEYGPNEWSKLTTDETGHATSGKLAYGTYVVKQTKASDEMTMLEETFEVTVSNDGDHFEYTINNVPMDYYVQIVKKDADSGKTVSLNNATFQIVKYNNGNVDANYDSAYLRTDENGIVSVKNGLFWYDQFTTNADNRLSIIESFGKYEGTTSEDKGSVAVPQKFPAGQYEIQEIETPEGYLLGQNISFELSSENVVESDEDGDAFLTVEYSDPKPTGRIELTKEFEDPDYIMHGSVTFDLYVTQDIVDPADGTVLYKAGDKYGTYELNEETNTIVIEGLPMGVGESHFKLVEATTYENYQLNTEEYPVDFVQTDDTTTTYTAEVTVENELIHISTKALNAKTDGKEFNSAKEITVTDTVSYEGILPNQEYTLHAVLMNKETGEQVMNEDGTPVEGYKKFTSETADGTVDVEMNLDASSLGGQDYVVYEYLLNTGLEGHEGCEIAKHEDLTDENQTITILESKIQTLAQSENGSHEQQIKDGEITLTDTISYSGLVPNMEYKLEGQLMNKETGQPLLDAEGIIESEATFTPETSEGTVDVTFTFDSSLVETGMSLVAFETLYEIEENPEGVFSKIEVANHKDIEDEGQTISFIDIHTKAQSENGSNEQQATEGGVTLTDTVSYEGLQPGKEYELSGKLMNKETGQPLLDAEGNEITAKTTFTPEEADGEVEVEFTFDLTGIEAGTDIVVFENLYREGIEIAVHTDIEDEDQTIHITDLHTEALSENGTHTAPTGSEVTITDTVTYTNLEPGKEYTVSGKLMDKETGEPLLDADEEEITAETTFTPEEPNGTVELVYTLDSTLLADKEIVVFEDLYKDEILVASHADIEDENQTIKFKHFEILVNKVDSATNTNIVSNEFEFTMYEDKECTKEVVTKAGNTENGTALFDVEEGVWYIKETAAPQGYLLSSEVVKVEVKDNKMYVNDKEVETNEDYLYSIVYLNTLTPVVNTGEGSNLPILLAVGAGILVAIAVIAVKTRKKRQ
ncbi:VaFE repeat-containing surface-anchored protein [Faecalicoccus acidiformans]|uniref:VaFE repeat-containing surface-anchored protein n=1 Tax=Faecalicoccus acidiformans TaxID=915173 RepID=A0ABS2FNM6_9FIRM|nr:VaFE repeat-containing surface-anchored protein [Faecalicoccus acidiformans]MBM6830980.1 VaFE repeat-containing surface-anchored protein [Faecalicoccus acidiformans]